jgi:chemotaxis protein MotB
MPTPRRAAAPPTVPRESAVQPSSKDGHHQTVVKRVSRKAHDEGHGGAWKVAFADFCLALLCLFLVLWLLASRETEAMQQVLQSAGAKMLGEGSGTSSAISPGMKGSLIERHPVPAHQTETRRGEADEVDPSKATKQYESHADFRDLARLIERASAEEGLTGNLQTAVTPQGLRLMLHDTESRGMFQRGSAVPSPRFRALLRKLGAVFARVDNQLLIIGHTDASQYSDKGPGAFSNSALSSYRAMSARFHLLEGGMSEGRVLQVSGMADSAPLDLQDPNAAINRRIELMVLTSRQSAAMANMFGAPRQSVAVAEGLSAETPEAMRELRKVVQPAAAN